VNLNKLHLATPGGGNPEGFKVGWKYTGTCSFVVDFSLKIIIIKLI
jgi:hypothetical protein